MSETANQTKLNAKHTRELLEKRGLDQEWVNVNCRSITAKEATDLLCYTALSDGIWLDGDGLTAQYKPDKPWLSDKDKDNDVKKAPKYRSRKGEFDAVLVKNPHNPSYWSNTDKLKQLCYTVDGHPCIVITEGFFKALSGCSNDIPTIGLLGVEMGLTPGKADPQGKRYLVEILSKYAKLRFGFIIAFDADCATNKNVLKAQQKLGHQILKFKVPVHVATGLWDVAEGKGMDDFILNNGADKFKREILGQVIDFESWEQQFKQDFSEEDKKQLPKADQLGALIAEDYRTRLKYNSEANCWMLYDLKRSVWTAIKDEVTESILDNELDVRNIQGYGSNSYVINVLKKMRNKLLTKEWNELSSTEYLPFQNCVLNITTGETLEHAPGHGFTWQLPRDYDAFAKEFPLINKWLDEATNGNTAIKDVLFCYLNAVIKGRSDLQMFLYLDGSGGTGKSTFINLAVALIGEENTRTTSLRDFCGNRFESANAYKKRLVFFADQDRYTGDLQKFKSLTGQDLISAENKGKKGFQFKFDGMVIINANKQVFVVDSSSWLARRRILVPFKQKINNNKRRDLMKDFEPELNALTNFLLSIPDETVTKVLRNAVNDIPAIAEEIREQQINTDSIAAWIDDCVIHDSTAKTIVGNDLDDEETLFGNYYQYCKKTGSIGKSLRNFSHDLMDFCVHIMDWSDVKKIRGSQGYSIKGLKLRSSFDTDNSYSTTENTVEQLCLSGVEQEQKTESATTNLEKMPIYPTHPTLPAPSKDFDPTLNPTLTLHSVGSDVESTLHSVGSDVVLKPAPSKESVGCVGSEALFSEKQDENKIESDVDEAIAPTPVPVVQTQEQQNIHEVSAEPTRAEMVEQVLACKTWAMLLKVLDTSATIVQSSRVNMFKAITRNLSSEEKQVLVKLLAEHLVRFPNEDDSYNWLPECGRTLKDKAIALAKQEENLRKQGNEPTVNDF